MVLSKRLDHLFFIMTDYSNVKFDSKKYSPLIFEEQPKLKPGTVAYDDFWDEQDHRCLNGYKPKGMPRITGEHYFYLNMCKISLLPPGARRKRPGSPFYRSLDRRLSLETEDAKDNGHGLIIGKPRRVGLSWFGAMQILYEMLFYYTNTVGVCAGKQDKADDFYSKVLYLLGTINENYKSGIITKNDEKLKLGYSYRENRQDVEEGLLSTMFIKTMFSDSSAFEGKEMALVIFEEAGLFENLIASYKATEPCFKDGAIRYGSPIIYGTGGEIEKGSKGYKEMWNKAKSYNLKKIFIPAFEYFPGDGIPDEKTGKSVTFFDFRTGETNQKAALKHILAEREVAKGSKDGYTKHVQSYPIKESEIFIKSSGGVLDRAILNTQLMRMNEGDIPVEVKRGRYEWIDGPVAAKLVPKARDAKERAMIRLKHKSKVRFVEDENGTAYKVAEPINKDSMSYKPDIGGVDSYDDKVDPDLKKTSHGASIVYRCYSGPSKEYDFPVAFIKERGDSTNDDTFFENTLMQAIYFNCEMLIEYSKIAIINYFKDVGAMNYMKERPMLEAVIGPTRAKNEFGQRVTQREKSLITKLLKSEVRDNVFKIYFEDIIIDLIDYGDVNTDLAMAYGMVLIFKLEMFHDIAEHLDDEEDYSEDPLNELTYYDVNSSGELQIKTYGGDTLFGMVNDIEFFDPKKHLSVAEKIEYDNHLMKEQKIKEDRIKEIQEKYSTDIMEAVISDFRKN